MTAQRTSILLVFTIFSCVERIEVPVVESRPSLVVDALLTDQPGPHVVTLTLSGAPEDDQATYVPGAIVEITESSGNVELLQEVLPGRYQTSDAYRGVLGEQYQLRIQTSTGTYQSETIQMQPAGEIENIYAVFRENVINQTDLTEPQDAIDVYIDGTGDPGYPSLLRWRWEGTYYVLTFPQIRLKVIEGEPGEPEYIIVPDPYPCSGYVERARQLTYVEPCQCCDCWVTDYSQRAHVSNNDAIRDGDFNNVFITRIPVDNWRFIDRYHLEVEQLSVSSDVHKFWKLIQAQQEGAANIFQPNVVQVEGNMASLTSPEEAVFGIFSVSAVARATIDIDRSIIPTVVPKLDTAIADCRTYFNNATNIKPPFW